MSDPAPGALKWVGASEYEWRGPALGWRATGNHTPGITNTPHRGEPEGSRDRPRALPASGLTFAHDRYDALVAETVAKLTELGRLKGGEYAGDDDRLANFRRNGAKLGLPMEAIWHTYTAKHWDAVEQYIKDLIAGKTRRRMEPLSGRLDDIIVYCILFKAMLIERETVAGEPALK